MDYYGRHIRSAPQSANQVEITRIYPTKTVKWIMHVDETTDPTKTQYDLTDIQSTLPTWVTPTVKSTMTTPVLNGRWVKTGTNRTIHCLVSTEPRDVISCTRNSLLSGSYVAITAAVVDQKNFERRRATI